MRGRAFEDTRSGEFEEGPRGWKKCACLIHVSGTLGGKFNRRQTGKSDWEEAKAWPPCGKRRIPGTARRSQHRPRSPRRVPYGWLKIYETLLFAFYNPRTGHCFPSHQAIATKARCSVSTVQRALKWARENSLIVWAHGLVRDGWRVLRTSNRWAFAAFLGMRRILASIAASNGQRRRGVPTSYKSLADIAAEAKSFRFPPAPSSV